MATRIRIKVRVKQARQSRRLCSSLNRSKNQNPKSEASKAGSNALPQPRSQKENQRQAKQSWMPCSSLHRNKKSKTKPKVSKAEPDVLLPPQSIHHQSIQASLVVSYPVLHSNHLQPMLGTVSSPMQVPRSNEEIWECSCSCSSALVTCLAS